MSRLAEELYVVALEAGRYLVYAPLGRAAFVANAATVAALGEPDGADGSLAAFLQKLGMLDVPPQAPPGLTCTGPPAPVAVTLLLTTACNLRCSYCYASGGDGPVKFMSLEVARRGIDFVAGNAVQRQCGWFEVNYHGGGEPTRHWAVLTGSLEYAREKAAATGLERRSSLATNGVLSDAEIDWIISNLRDATVSFDGLPEVHDRHRVSREGAGSSERVMHTMRRFEAAGFGYGLRMTVTAGDIASLPESIEYVCANFRPHTIQVEPVYLLGRWREGLPAETEEFIAAYRAAQERARAHGRELFFSAARLGTLTNHFCAISQDGFCLTPDGNVTACYEVSTESHPWARRFFYGRPRQGAEGYDFDLEVLEGLRAQAVQNREYCRDCFAKWTCGGDCYHKALAVHGEGEFQGAGRCHITRELTKDQILAKIAASGGLFWHEPL